MFYTPRVNTISYLIRINSIFFYCHVVKYTVCSTACRSGTKNDYSWKDKCKIKFFYLMRQATRDVSQAYQSVFQTYESSCINSLAPVKNLELLWLVFFQNFIRRILNEGYIWKLTTLCVYCRKKENAVLAWVHSYFPSDNIVIKRQTMRVSYVNIIFKKRNICTTYLSANVWIKLILFLNVIYILNDKITNRYNSKSNILKFHRQIITIVKISGTLL